MTDPTLVLVLTRLAMALEWNDDELRAVVEELVGDFGEMGFRQED